MCAEEPEDTEGLGFREEGIEEAAEFPLGQVGAHCSLQNKDSIFGWLFGFVDGTFDASANLICLFLSVHLSA